VKREFSAGGVLVRRLRGRWVFAAIRPAGKKPGLWALPKGQIDASERPEETALREAAEETGAHGRVVGKLGDVRYVYTWDGERIFKVVSFYYDPPRLVAGDDDAVYALNFYSPMVADQLRSGRKSATIRLGDKSRKYRKGMIVQVLAGTRFSPRQKIFDAVIDKVEVKTLAELSPREIEHDNPEIRRPEEMAGFLGQLYNREVADDELVTVIRFSEIRS
jgi:ADP-ribose pyrophosphatase YjhB (NUDIX family)